MRAQRMRERCQASRRGLNGSGASGRALLAVREKARGRCGEVGEGDHRQIDRRRKRRQAAHHRCQRAEGAAQVAFLHAAAVVVIACGALTMVMAGMVVCRRGVRRGHHRFVVMAMLHDRWRLHLANHARRRAQHRRSHRTANGQQHGEQHQQAEAKGFQIRKQRPTQGWTLNLATGARSSRSSLALLPASVPAAPASNHTTPASVRAWSSTAKHRRCREGERSTRPSSRRSALRRRTACPRSAAGWPALRGVPS